MAIGNLSKKKTSVSQDVHELVMNLKKEVIERSAEDMRLDGEISSVVETIDIIQTTVEEARDSAGAAWQTADNAMAAAENARLKAEGASLAIDHHLNDQNNPHSVTKDQVGLDQVENVRQASKTEFDDQTAYTDNMIAGMVLDVRQLYIMLGVNLIDGGLFGEPQDGAALDGGDFESEPTGVFDCGDFNPPAILPIGDTVDGGKF